MMKKLLYGLLVLTGAGMLSSCQQDEAVSEAPVNKGVTIRASLPNDGHSRVVLGDTEGNAGTTTQVYWEEGDEITLQIDEETSYVFTISEDYEDEYPSTSAEFTYSGEGDITLDAGETYTFTYGAAPQKVQAGTKDGLSAYHLMQATYTAQEGDGWDDVLLSFSTKVALVEISLDVPATKVSMYDVKTGACLATATAAEGTPFTGKVYFSVLPGTYEALFMMEDNSDTYVKKVGEKTLAASKLYRIKITEGNPIESVTLDSNGSVKYFTLDDVTTYIYGQGDIPDYTFCNNNSLTSVVILEGVTGIGEGAFLECSSLSSLTLPASIVTIGKFAFTNCPNLEAVTFAEDSQLQNISYQSFAACGLSSITLPASVTTIGTEAFGGCPNLTTVTFAEGSQLSSIGPSAFSSCSSLSSITLPTSVTTIGEFAFVYCSSLSSITLPASVVTIGDYAFYDCTNLATVTCLAENPPSLGSFVFASSPIATIYVPSGSEEDYKVAEEWSSYSSIIQAISTSEE